MYNNGLTGICAYKQLCNTAMGKYINNYYSSLFQVNTTKIHNLNQLATCKSKEGLLR